jgi:uncharacterized protein
VADKHRSSEGRAHELVLALRRSDVETVSRLLTEDSSLARCIIDSRTPLHIFADAPGHRPGARPIVDALVAAGADLDAHVSDAWHHETPLHWAASNDDVELIDALLDAGADIEHPGSSIGGGPPIQSALGYAQWKAVRRLWERGAQVGLSHVAALGLIDEVRSAVDGAAPADVDVAFWNACRGGQVAVAEYLLEHGADLNWRAPWSGETPLAAARARSERAVVTWLEIKGAVCASDRHP